MSVEEYFADLWKRWQRGEAKPACYEPSRDAQLSKCHEHERHVRQFSVMACLFCRGRDMNAGGLGFHYGKPTAIAVAQ